MSVDALLNSVPSGGHVIGDVEPLTTILQTPEGKRYLLPGVVVADISNEAIEKIALVVVRKIAEAMTQRRQNQEAANG